MRARAWIAIGVVLASALASASAPAQEAMPTTAPDVPKEAEEKAWAFSLSAYTYVVPDDKDYVQPTITADHDWLHLEARYNYEARNTASVWAGYNFSGGDKIAWEFTPMIGGVLGDAVGVAPGYKGSLNWWKFELYSEGEYLLNADVFEDSFFYNWSELTFAPVDWFRFGVVTQRTRAYESDRDIQRGPLVGFTWKNVDLAAYVFDPDESKPVYVFSLGLSF